MKITTPIEYMLELEWDLNDVERGKKFLKEWDSRTDSFYKEYHPNTKCFDKAEREHYRNCVNFWTERLNDENKPS